MPTLVLLDNSFSMNKNLDNNGTKTSLKDISIKIINRIIDHFNKNEKFEHFALVIIKF
jgi:hypothetical protein